MAECLLAPSVKTQLLIECRPRHDVKVFVVRQTPYRAALTAIRLNVDKSRVGEISTSSVPFPNHEEGHIDVGGGNLPNSEFVRVRVEQNSVRLTRHEYFFRNAGTSR